MGTVTIFADLHADSRCGATMTVKMNNENGDCPYLPSLDRRVAAGYDVCMMLEIAPRDRFQPPRLTRATSRALPALLAVVVR
ncbi:MAG: hypothetical protein KGY99_10255 [Phycisphaerae bacterium]|nr:hypothetical protein [Phycisphaerae bacterium]